MSAADNLSHAQFQSWTEHVPNYKPGMSVNDVPGAGALESYHIYKGSDAAAVADTLEKQGVGNYDSFHEETRDVPLSDIRYFHQQRVIREHVENLSKVPGHELPPAWGQAQPDGSVTLIEGHHRAAAAARRGDTHVNTVVYGKWDRHTERPPAPSDGRPW